MSQAKKLLPALAKAGGSRRW